MSFIFNLGTVSNQSSFFSLSRFSGILIGIYGLFVAYIVNFLTDGYSGGFGGTSMLPIAFIEIFVIVSAILFILIALLTLWIKARKKARNNDTKLWSSVSKKLRANLLISLLIIAVILIVIANMGYYSLITPLALLLYGLFLLNLSRIESGKLKYLAITEIILAIGAYFIYDKEIIFLVIGFGVFHIIYGLLTFKK